MEQVPIGPVCVSIIRSNFVMAVSIYFSTLRNPIDKRAYAGSDWCHRFDMPSSFRRGWCPGPALGCRLGKS